MDQTTEFSTATEFHRDVRTILADSGATVSHRQLGEPGERTIHMISIDNIERVPGHIMTEVMVLAHDTGMNVGPFGEFEKGSGEYSVDLYITEN